MTDTPHPSARYVDRAHRYADAFQDETLPQFPADRNMIRMLVDLVGGHPRVLDAGFGAGQVTKMLQNWGCDAVGVDAAEKLIELARTACSRARANVPKRIAHPRGRRRCRLTGATPLRHAL